MDLKSAKLIKVKALLFMLITAACTVLLGAAVYPLLTWEVVLFYVLSLWGACRAYYFCFYVLEKYVDPNFRYTGLFDLLLHALRVKKKA